MYNNWVKWHVWCTFRFDIGLLTDQFDAGLILLKRRFCWSHADIFYKRQEVGVSRGKKTLSDEAKRILLSPEFNLGDQLLYEAFNATWWSRPEVRDPDFLAEVAVMNAHSLKVLLSPQNSMVAIPLLLKPFCYRQRLWHSVILRAQTLC